MPNFTLADAPKPQKSSAELVELLDVAPKVMRRSLMLMNGYAYAASMQFAKVGSKPKVEQVFTVLRNDGQIFYEKQQSFSKLGFLVNIAQLPNPEMALSSKAIKRYIAGERVNVKVLFEQLCRVADRFIDFEKSLASQNEMCELIACEILATYCLDGFNVTGFVWINGEKGSGKTQLLTLMSLLCYDGRLFLSAGTPASLRDHADIGSTLCIDEAENFNHAQFSIDKREILLSGNRKGSQISLKRIDKDKNWITRYTNTYCKKIFASIVRPEPVIASRSIIIPLIRTSNKAKANSDILDYKLWPVDRGALVDDLWLFALANLHRMSEYETRVNEMSPLSGRSLEPWRDVLSVALCLEEYGVSGLWERMNKLSLNYQNERKNIEGIDVNALIIMALCKHLGYEIGELSEGCEGDIGGKVVQTSDISTEAILLSSELDLDISDDELNTVKIGKKMSSLGFRKHRQGGTGKAGWRVGRPELARWIQVLGLNKTSDEDVPVEASQPSQPSQGSQTFTIDL